MAGNELTPRPSRNCVTPSWRTRFDFPKANRFRDRLTFRVRRRPEETRRLDKYLVERFEGYSRTFFQELIAGEKVLVNGKPAAKNSKLRDGDAVTILLPEGAPDEPENIPLDIIYEDAGIIVLSKPPGIVVHPARGNMTGTLRNALFYYFRDEMEADSCFKVYNLHRLDKWTTGVMVFGKSAAATKLIARQFEKREIRKRYLLWVHGEPEWEQASCDEPLGADPEMPVRVAVRGTGAREAHTVFRRLGAGCGVSLLEAFPKTGRSHQIRVHAAHTGFPVVGDTLYGGETKIPGAGFTADRYMLHALEIRFAYPARDDEACFRCPPPEDFARLAEKTGIPLPFIEESAD